MESLAYFQEHLPEYLADLRELVEIESPTFDVKQAENAAALLAKRFAPFGELDTEKLDGYGPLLHLHRPGASSRVMLCAHFDTVWPVGSWPETWSERDGRIFGPGVYDMKSGLLFILWALRYLHDSGRPHPELDLILNPDEEVGSRGSRTRIDRIAESVDYALVLEPANPDGSVKLERKGSGEYRIEIRGRSAHQGAEPELGINAVVEAAHQVLRMLEFEDGAAGTTVGPNVISGGTAANSVADRVELLVDVRAWTRDEQQRLEGAIASLSPVLEGSELTINGRWNRPPMESSPASLALFTRAQEIGRRLGQDLKWVRWGGSSDANLTAAVGVPTIDGLGPIGNGAHQMTENIIVDALPRRMALFTELLASLVDPP
jgi:glutamate carboxypeptidase